MIRELHNENFKEGKLGYILYTPEKVEKNLPLIIFLHGAGERGSNLEHVERLNIPKMIKEGYELDAVVLCPQCPGEFVWNNLVREVKKLIDEIAEEYQSDLSRISITGSSMGGYGTWEMGLTYPNFFSAMAPVCGGAMPWRAGNLRNTPVRTWHGEIDTVVHLVNSELMVDKVNERGGNAQLHVLQGFAHNDGAEEAYNNTDLISWLLSQQRTDFEPVPEALSELF